MDEGDPRYHTQRMKARLEEMIKHLREDIEKVDEPQLKAMFETSAEVLTGLTRHSIITSAKTRAPGRADLLPSRTPRAVARSRTVSGPAIGARTEKTSSPF